MYYGTISGEYEYSVDVGNTTSCSIAGLTEGTTYYLVATAYNTNNFESSFSEELVHTITSQPPIADLAAMPVSGMAPLMVTFDASDSSDANGTISNYRWNFGDGSIGSGMMIDHTYTSVGQYTAVLTVTDDVGATDNASVVITVESVINDNPPTVSIINPANGASFDSGEIISFDGTASDNEDGDLTNGLIWTSDLQGQLSTVGSFTTVLNEGIHTITAEVTDSGDSTASDSINITVSGGSDDGFTLSVNAYKVKGGKYAELTWNGATSINVNVYRDDGQIATTANDGAYTHGPFGKGKPAKYQVCEAGTSSCSNTVSVSW